MSILTQSWSAFSEEIAGKYLKTFGSPSFASKELLTEILKESSKFGRVNILDLGSGNGQLYEYFKEQGLNCLYTGVDFSDVLLASAKKNNPEAKFIKGDLNDLGHLEGSYDVAVFSHVVEILSSPENALLAARKLAKKVVIRFFEPPEFEVDTVDLVEMDVGGGHKVPYIRRKMSRDYYRLILSKMKCSSVDVYWDGCKDQVHVLHY